VLMWSFAHVLMECRFDQGQRNASTFALHELADTANAAGWQGARWSVHEHMAT